MISVDLRKSPTADAEKIYVEKGSKIEELVAKYSDTEEKYGPILLAKIDNKMVELSESIEEPCSVTLLDLSYPSVEFAYQRSLCLLYLKSIYDVLGEDNVVLGNSLNKGIYSEIRSGRTITEDDINKIIARMQELVDMDLPIEKEEMQLVDAIAFLESIGQHKRTPILRTMAENNYIYFYSVDGFRDFFHGIMLTRTSQLNMFDVRKYKSGILLRFPHRDCPGRIPEYKNEYMLYEAFRESAKWRKIVGLRYVDDLNEKIKSGEGKNLIMLYEALHEKRIAQLADTIKHEKKRMILIAGPSSSGKTTFAQRLCVQLRVNGMKPLYLGTDDFFLDRKDTPKDEDGNYDFESIRAIDIDLFNDNMNSLLAGEEVDLPVFDFMSGKKVYGRRITKHDPEQPVVIEGIHGLNRKLTEHIADSEKFKIYISPLTTLGIDVHNRIPTTDARLLRRIVRDYQFRGRSAKETIKDWTKVRDGEKVNIFPFSGEADAFFNSNHAYEITVLKKYVEPLLMEITEADEEYAEAVRLLNFLKFFETMHDDSAVANNSILREFIGGSTIV